MEGEERYVPGNYVKMKHQVPWFLGHIERLEAEEILRKYRKKQILKIMTF
jgi:hypothetical protein